jgi:photosystem II stability/assembly factor-like uncharacterized protein
MREMKLGMLAKDLVIVKDEPKVVYAATALGIMRSADSGETWEKLNIIPPDKKAMITTIAVNPVNAKEFYYSTYTAFYRTLDGGATWASIKLPTTRAGWKLLIDPEKPNILYMGVRVFMQK